MYTVSNDPHAANDQPSQRRLRRLRLAVFLCVFIVVGGGGLIYDYSRPAIYRAMSRLSVEPPGDTADPVTTAQFAIAEAQAMRRSDFVEQVVSRLQSTSNSGVDRRELERKFLAEAVPQTGVIELRVEGHDRQQLIAALSAWIEVYTSSRKEADRQEVTDALEEARHASRMAQESVEGKRREMEAYRSRHGIVSSERDENPSAARLKGLNNSLNDAMAREVNAEARLKALNDNLVQGNGVIRAADKAAIGNMEMRAVDLRERVKDLEHDYTAQYLALDPKFKALKANLARIEQQINLEKERSRQAALLEAQEEYAGARRATQRLREQAEGLKQESQTFSARFVELRRMATDLEQLQDARRVATDRLAKLESARKPAAVRIRVLSAASVTDEPIAPNYSRDAAIVLALALILALGAVGTLDYLSRDPQPQPGQTQPPIIQIAYPMLQSHAGATSPTTASAPPALLGQPAPARSIQELSVPEVSALWRNADAMGRLIIAAMFSGIAPSELKQLAWKHIDLANDLVDIPGAAARSLALIEPLREEIKEAGRKRRTTDPEATLLALGSDETADAAALDRALAFAAHDAGLRRPEEISTEVLQFTYAAYLVRQGIRMTDLAAAVGKLAGPIASELMRLSPPGLALTADRIEMVYPSFRAS